MIPFFSNLENLCMKIEMIIQNMMYQIHIKRNYENMNSKYLTFN